jgi:hypothetical protein
MGKGNPESADAVIARESDIFIADKLSDLNKQQLDMLKVHWVELRSENGFERFTKILDAYKIPYTATIKDFDTKLETILNSLF